MTTTTAAERLQEEFLRRSTELAAAGAAATNGPGSPTRAAPAAAHADPLSPRAPDVSAIEPSAAGSSRFHSFGADLNVEAPRNWDSEEDDGAEVPRRRLQLGTKTRDRNPLSRR